LKRQEFLPYCRPSVDADDIRAVVDTLERGWLTTGPIVKRFEAQFAAASGTKHAVALNSCTAAMHLGLLALGVGPGDEVVLPSMSFVAGANCVLQVGAEPVFCDVEPETLCVSVATIEKAVSKRTKALLTMHYAGRPASAGPIAAYAKSRGLKVMEDAALSVGMLDDGRWSGTRCDAAVYSFYATKNVTSAEGGMLVTDDDAIAERVRGLSLHGMDKDAWRRYERGGAWRYDVLETGYKYNMPDMAAALGVSQLGRLPAMQRRREALAARFIEGLESIRGVTPAALAALGPRDKHSWCVFPVFVEESEAGISRDDLIEALRAENIGTSVHYIPSHLFTAHRGRRSAPLPATEAQWGKLISLPLFPGMSDADADDVIDALRASIPAASTSRVGL
jgi:dTDP-4-amino-4,6-dideoxygalactose transaminase